MGSRGILEYRIDSQDRIVHLGEGWREFAEANGGGPLAVPDLVLDRSIWDFVVDETTRSLYELLFAKVRALGLPVTVPIRCDAPHLRRHIDVTMRCLQDEHVVFECQVTREEPRDALDILNMEVRRSDEEVRICSWCKAIQLDDEDWAATEVAVEHLDLFRSATQPRLAHATCPDCLREVMGSIR